MSALGPVFLLLDLGWDIVVCSVLQITPQDWRLAASGQECSSCFNSVLFALWVQECCVLRRCSIAVAFSTGSWRCIVCLAPPLHSSVLFQHVCGYLMCLQGIAVAQCGLSVCHIRCANTVTSNPIKNISDEHEWVSEGAGQKTCFKFVCKPIFAIPLQCTFRSIMWLQKH